MLPICMVPDLHGSRFVNVHASDLHGSRVTFPNIGRFCFLRFGAKVAVEQSKSLLFTGYRLCRRPLQSSMNRLLDAWRGLIFFPLGICGAVANALMAFRRGLFWGELVVCSQHKPMWLHKDMQEASAGRAGSVWPGR